MKENTKRYVKLSIILYIVILSVALVGTLAWFVFERSATITTEDEGKIVVGEYLEICVDDGDDDPTNDNWITEHALASPAQYPDVSVTPDGTVWYPTTLTDDDQLVTGEEGNGAYTNVTNTPDGYYVKLNLKVRASKGLDVYLHRDSTVKGVNMDKTDAAGAFSKDAVAGAARVAFFDKNGLVTVWVPNETYELSFDAENKPSFDVSGRPEESYKYLVVQDDGTVTKDNEYETWTDKQLTVGENELADDGMANEATALLSFDAAGEQKLTVYIWVEGSDREANTVLSGGSLKYDIKLIGVPKKAESSLNIDDVEYSADTLICSSTDEEVGSEILYSYDKKTWQPYSTNNPDLAGDSAVIYVRAAETATQKLGRIKEITIS